jgi:aspartate aminotransferase/aminotransferase
VIFDEVYEDIVFEGTHTSGGLFNDDGRVVVIFSFSKTYAVTGLRVGYAVCDEKLARLVTKLQEPVVSCASGISQKACLAALKGSQDSVLEMVKTYRARRDAVVEILKKRGLFKYIPRGAFYMLIDISRTGMNSMDFAVKLLNERKVAVAPGETFGDTVQFHIRISFATDTDKLLEGIHILCDWIEEKSN